LWLLAATFNGMFTHHFVNLSAPHDGNSPILQEVDTTTQHELQRPDRLLLENHNFTDLAHTLLSLLAAPRRVILHRIINMRRAH
jgi:hypothetical protein